MRWKIAYSTNAFTRYTLEQAIELIRTLGFDGVEILADAPHAFFPHLGPADYRKIESWIRKSRLAVSNVNVNTCRGFFRFTEHPSPGPTLVDTDPTARKMRLEYILQALRFAKRLRVPTISITSGPPSNGASTSRMVGFFNRALEEVLAEAQRLRIKVGIEYEPGYVIGDSKSLARVLRSWDSPVLGANLDIGHAWVASEDPASVIENLGGRIWNIHIEDIKGLRHFHLIPGEGDIDFEKIRKALVTVNYRGFLTLELYTYPHDPVSAGRRGLEVLRNLFGQF